MRKMVRLFAILCLSSLASFGWGQSQNITVPLNFSITKCSQGQLEAGIYAEWDNVYCAFESNAAFPAYNCDYAYFDHNQPAASEFDRCRVGLCCCYRWWFPDYQLAADYPQCNIGTALSLDVSLPLRLRR